MSFNENAPARAESQSIKAYSALERIASYDSDMDVMHPNRLKMAEIALEIMPFLPDAALRALDLGSGTGYFIERFLRRYPLARVAAADGSAVMTDLARARLGALAERADFRVGDFRELDRLLKPGEQFDVVFSSFALHHLNRAEKLAALKRAVAALRPGGWFFNADLVTIPSAALDARVQTLRAEGVTRRAAEAGLSDPRFADVAATRAFLEALQREDGDQPLLLEEDLALLREAGIANASTLWAEYREAVLGGCK